MNMQEKLDQILGKEISQASNEEIYDALLTIVQEMASKKERTDSKKKLYYISAEFLIGKLLSNNMINLGIYKEVKEILEKHGKNLSEIEEIEPEPSLGNGGLGRLAACFLDSIATLGLAGDGVGLNYHLGLFRQEFKNNLQKETPNPWIEKKSWLKKTDIVYPVSFRGLDVKARMYDIEVTGYNNLTNKLHLFDLDSVDETIVEDGIDFDKKEIEKNLTLFLYPDDSDENGRLLRIYQQYFMVSAGAQMILDECVAKGCKLYDLPEYAVIQINDTHPTMVIPELIRLLMLRGMDMDDAVKVVSETCAYTNHTILAEALEKWPVEMMKKLLPRIYMIIEEIDRRYVEYLQSKYHDDWGKINYMRIINNGEVRMAHLCIRGSHSVNGVAKLHTEILKHEELKDFYNDEPYKFNNKTNGIAHRRWLMSCNKELSDLITELIGDDWKKDTSKLKDLEKYLDNKKVLDRVGEIKYNNKVKLADYIYEKQGIKVDPNSIFDVQIKRLHAYKRQLLNVLHILYLYHEILDNPEFEIIPRTFIFGAKAAPGYYLAKCIIKLINSVADLINNDPRVKDKVKVVFIENYGVSIAEKIIPAANVSEQISTTTKEASGTGNMKLMMNGAITMATMDGANVEISEQVGKENMFIFGLNAEQVLEYNKCGGYSSKDLYHSDRKIKRVVDD